MKRVLFVTCTAALFLAPTALWAEEVTEMTWMSGNTDPYAFRDMQRRFDVTVTSNGICENDDENREAMLAARRQPDFGNWWGDPIELYHDGVTRPIPKKWIREHAPNIAEIYDDYPLSWVAWENPDDPDELLSLNGIAAEIDGNVILPFFRYDVAAEVWRELPDQGKIPLDMDRRIFYYEYDMTWDEMGDLLRGYRDARPGGVEIPLGACNDNYRCLNPWLGAFGIRGDATNREVDGQLYHSHTDPGMKEFIKAFGAWFAEGLIDRDLPSLSHRDFREKGQAGLYGVQSRPYTDAALYRSDGELGQYDSEVAFFIPPIIGPGSERGSRARSLFGGVGDYKFYASADVSDFKLKRMLDMLDYYMGTIEGWVTFRNGQQGVDFDWAGLPYESNPIPRDQQAGFRPPVCHPPGGVSFYPVFHTLDRLKIIVIPKSLADFQSTYALVDGGAKVYASRSYRDDFFNETDYEDVDQRFMSTLNTMWTEFFYKGITGQIDIDAEWDAYVQAWSDAGGADIVAELEKAPIVSELRRGRRVY